MQKSFEGARHSARVQAFSREHVVAQPNRPARAGKLAYIGGRTGARHNRADGIRARIKSGNYQGRGSQRHEGKPGRRGLEEELPGRMAANRTRFTNASL